ncbi:PREDICTED: TBC1 domain family member 20 [Rhagoletis zephyria]|uniref:TBC1 domain family member 20 n=1 Tax=Rhagoletis zephyria TaxID=28612 RepID=UPI0008115017|nr:PREDICTED: TBC1 domain family member 20 [Rhagoletis zephyria]XP_036336888.1 TBC1 domain family member 20 [Rhagoletis pomonella]
MSRQMNGGNMQHNEINIDQPQELCFEKCPESSEEQHKRLEIERLLQEHKNCIPFQKLQELARSDHGLVTDELRRLLWPQLAGVDTSNLGPAPSLSDLQTHPEYQQVVLDVNRSLKRFPPGIPYEQRIALQDQLTVLILRVIKKYPNLRYYQGYHDVAVTFLLVVGEEVAFAVMEELSTNHFSECMQETMDATQKRLMFIWPLVDFENPQLFQFLQESAVGTLFALPWYLTWFGHSLNSYKDVVRLYDYFLASPIYMPIFVTAAIILHRAEEILKVDCDMASVHCLLSKLPDDLPFEELLKTSSFLYDKYSLTVIEKHVEELIRREKLQRQLEEKRIQERRKQLARNARAGNNAFARWLPQVLTPKSMIVTTAFSILVGICAYYYKNQYLSAGVS